MWQQKIITLPAYSQGFHLVSDEICQQLPEIAACEIGLLHLLLQHTSASLSLNENADADVRYDLAQRLGVLAPESNSYRHQCEGPDDMPAHITQALLGSQLTLPIREGQLALGTWQGIYLGEHRYHGGKRRIVATIHGQSY